MLVAGLLFAAGALALAEAGRRAGARVAVAAGLGGATALGLLGAVLQLPSASEIGQGALYPCIYLGVALAVFALGWTHASSAVGVSRTAASLLGVPVLVMALAGVERMTAVYGPNPIAWSGALAGAAVLAAGVAVVWLAEPLADAEPGRRSRSLRWAWGLALVATALAVASLFTPALDALAEGGTGEPFRVNWTMVGAESAAGWLAVAAAGLALAAVMVARRGGSARSWVPASVAAVVCAVAAIPLLGTTLHTWNRWVPAEVQQTYGTEYSRLVVEAHLEPLRVTAMVLVDRRGRSSRTRAGARPGAGQCAQGGSAMRRLVRIVMALAIVAVLGTATACQRTVEVQTGTRIVDSSGRVISEDIKTLRVPPATAGAYRINTIVQPDETAQPQVAALYAEAQAAIGAGNLTLAAVEARRGHRVGAGLRQGQGTV